jgi:hypothetical protein
MAAGCPDKYSFSPQFFFLFSAYHPSGNFSIFASVRYVVKEVKHSPCPSEILYSFVLYEHCTVCWIFKVPARNKKWNLDTDKKESVK